MHQPINLQHLQLVKKRHTRSTAPLSGQEDTLRTGKPELTICTDVTVPCVVSPQGFSGAPPSFPPLHLPSVSQHCDSAVSDVLQPEHFSPELPKRLSPQPCLGEANWDQWHLPPISERLCTVASSHSQSPRDNQPKAEPRRLCSEQLPPLLPAKEGNISTFLFLECIPVSRHSSVGSCWQGMRRTSIPSLRRRQKKRTD